MIELLKEVVKLLDDPEKLKVLIEIIQLIKGAKD